MSNQNNTFHLRCGQKIQLVELNQCLTYEGLLGGVPNETSNARLIERALEGAKRPQREGAPHLIAPVEKPIELDKRQKAQAKEHPSPFGAPSLLPGVQCVGRFESLESEDGDEDEAEEREDEESELLDPKRLVVVWFQDEFALPIEASVMAAIQQLDWDAVAHGDGDWNGCRIGQRSVAETSS